MEVTCQRCHETLREADCYCAVCGLPQLVYVDGGGTGEVAAGSAGEADGPGSVPAPGASGIAWRQALQMALLVAIPSGVLCSRMGSMDWFWTMLAALWVVRLYARRVAPLRVTAGAGARIGLVTGILTGWLVLAILCGQLWTERVLLHQGGQIDAEFEQGLQPRFAQQQQLLVNMGVAGAQAAREVANFKAFVFSSEGRAGFFLASLLISMAILVFFAVMGGALGARLTAQIRRPAA